MPDWTALLVLFFFLGLGLVTIGFVLAGFSLAVGLWVNDVMLGRIGIGMVIA